MDLRGYAGAIRKHRWLFLFFVVVLTAIATTYAYLQKPTYASSVEFFVSTPQATNGTALDADQFAQKRVNSYSKLLTSERLANEIISDTGVDLSARDVQSRITPSVDLNTVLLQATVVDTSKERSLEITRSIADNFGALVNRVDSRMTSTAVSLNVVSGPMLQPGQVSPNKKVDIGLGLLIGIALGVAATVLRELLDTSVRGAEVLRSEFARPVVGTVAFDPSAQRLPLIVDEQARSVRAESIRQLRTNLRFSGIDHPVRAILVTSSVASEGKSATATNLALVFAEAGSSVLLIEADLRRPRVTEYLGLEREIGLTNVLAGEVDLDDALQPWGSGGMQVLPSGSIPPNPSELLGSQNMVDLMRRLRDRFDVIIVDTPPLLPVTDAAVVSRLCDGVVMVVRHGRTSRANVSASIAALDAVDARVLGFVLNMVPRRDTGKSAYDGYGYYEDSAGGSRMAGRRAPLRRRSRQQANEPLSPGDPVVDHVVPAAVDVLARDVPAGRGPASELDRPTGADDGPYSAGIKPRPYTDDPVPVRQPDRVGSEYRDAHTRAAADDEPPELRSVRSRTRSRRPMPGARPPVAGPRRR